MSDTRERDVMGLTEAENHGMVLVEKHLRNHLTPKPLEWADTPSTRLGCFLALLPTLLGMQPRTQSLWAARAHGCLMFSFTSTSSSSSPHGHSQPISFSACICAGDCPKPSALCNQPCWTSWGLHILNSPSCTWLSGRHPLSPVCDLTTQFGDVGYHGEGADTTAYVTNRAVK